MEKVKSYTARARKFICSTIGHRSHPIYFDGFGMTADYCPRCKKIDNLRPTLDYSVDNKRIPHRMHQA